MKRAGNMGLFHENIDSHVSTAVRSNANRFIHNCCDTIVRNNAKWQIVAEIGEQKNGTIYLDYTIALEKKKL